MEFENKDENVLEKYGRDIVKSVKDNKVELVENVSNIRRYIETSVMK